MSDTLLRLFSYDYGKDHCRLHDLPHEDWQFFAAKTYAYAVEREAKDGLLIVASWLAMRAATLGWMDDFARWAAKAHSVGTPNRELVGSSRFKAASVKLVQEERLYAAAKVFRREYEEAFGYPLHLITTAMEMR
jgi:hypothetical protein